MFDCKFCEGATNIVHTNVRILKKVKVRDKKNTKRHIASIVLNNSKQKKIQFRLKIFCNKAITTEVKMTSVCVGVCVCVCVIHWKILLFVIANCVYFVAVSIVMHVADGRMDDFYLFAQ